MIDRAMIEQRFRKKQSEIAALEEKLRASKAYLAALADILKLDGPDEVDGPEAKLRAGSSAAQTRDIIKQRGLPVHIDDLLRAMGKEVTRDAKASLAGSLAAYVRKEEIFSRPAPNTYGLIELGHATAAEDEPEPPENFGQARHAPAFEEDLDDAPF